MKYLILILFLLAGCIDDSIIKPGENTAFLYMRDGDNKSSGTSFAISEDLWVTAAHVVDKGVGSIQLKDGWYDIEIVYFDKDVDLAFFKISDYIVQDYIPLCGGVALGQPVEAFVVDLDFKLDSDDGVVTTVRKKEDKWALRLIETSIDGDYGWSGGPMLTYDIPQERTCAIGMTVAGRWKTLPYLEAIRASDIERLR